MELKNKLDALSLEIEMLTKELVDWQSLKDRYFDEMIKTKNDRLAEEYVKVAKKLENCRNRLAEAQKRYVDFIAKNDKDGNLSKYPAEIIRLAYIGEVPDELKLLVEAVKSDLAIAIGRQIPTKSEKSVQLGE